MLAYQKQKKTQVGGCPFAEVSAAVNSAKLTNVTKGLLTHGLIEWTAVNQGITCG